MVEATIASAALPNRLAPGDLHVRPGPGGAVRVRPDTAGWRYLSFWTQRLEHEPLSVASESQESVVVLLSGPDLVVRDVGALPGRLSPFDGLPSAVHVPAGAQAELSASGPVDLAIAQAPRSSDENAQRRPVLIGPEAIEVEIRGAGNATRQINHIVKPDFTADRLLVVEVLTPSGNWSSWPPHKHDEDRMPDEAVLEEVYHYRFRRPEAWGLQRLYRRPGTPLFDAAGPRDATFVVHHGDTVLVTDGYHPFVAAHGDDAYYLNALAGDRRTMACSFDPDLDWVRSSWSSLAPDPRVPLVAR